MDESQKLQFSYIDSFRYFILLAILFLVMVFIGLPIMGSLYILGDIGGGVQTASWGVSFFILGNMITKPFGRVFSEKIGLFHLLKICLVLSIIFFIPIIFVNNYNTYLVFRYLCGFVSGPIFSLVTNILKKRRPKEETSFIIACVLTITLIGPNLGAVFGCVVSYANLWRASFIVVYGLFIILTVLFFILFKGYRAEICDKPIDYLGSLIFCIAMTGLGFCLVSGQIIDGFRSFAFNLVLIVSIALFLFFFIWNHFHPNPILDLSFFKRRKFLQAAIHLFTVFGIYSATNMLLSYWLVLYANYTVKYIGYTLSLSSAGPLLFAFSYKYRRSKISIWLMLFSLAIFTANTFGISHFNVEVDLFRIGLVKMLNGFAYALSLPVLVTNIKDCFDDSNFPSGWVYFVMVKLLGYFVGISFFAMLWERRAAFYHWRLGGELTPFSQNLKNTFQWLGDFHFNSMMKVEGLNNALNRQSRALALEDCFYLMTRIAFGVLVLTMINALYDYFKKKRSETTVDENPSTI